MVGTVNYRQSAFPSSVRRTHLGQTNLLQGTLCAVDVDLPCCGQDEKTGLVNLRSRVRNISENGTWHQSNSLFAPRHSEADNIPCSRKNFPKVFLAGSDTRSKSRSSARDAAPIDRIQWCSRPGLSSACDRCLCKQHSPKTSLNNFEAPTQSRFAADDPVLNVDLDVLVLDLAVAFGGVVVAEHLHGANDVDPLRLWVDEDKRVAFVGRRVGRVRHGENDVNGVAWITGA